MQPRPAQRWRATGKRIIREHRAVILLSAIIYVMARYSVTYGAGTDPRYTLIVSQSILDHGTIQLNAYQGDAIWGKLANLESDPNIVTVKGRFYNYFPVGPSVLSLPFVALVRVAGWDMRLPQDNINAQRLLSAVTAVLALWLLYLTSLQYMDRASSLVVASVMTLGSTLLSTLAVALWSSNFSILFLGLALLLLARYDAGRSTTTHPWALGGLLFLAFFCRASAAAFILPTLLYLWWKQPRQVVLASICAAVPLALFLLWSRIEFGNWLPIYYSVARLQAERDPLSRALLGHLFSPSRGLFVYSPFLLLLIPGFWWCRSKLARRPLVWLCLSWMALHLWVASRAASWWGGDSFGPRILAELMPGFALLTSLLWMEARPSLAPRRAKGLVGFYILLAIPALFIHSYQGLFNYSAAVWNVMTEAKPAVPFTPAWGDLFNWRIPQFMASNRMLCRLELERTEMALARLPLLQTYPWDMPLVYGRETVVDVSAVAALLEADLPPSQRLKAAFVGWDPVDNDRAPHRATQCDEIHVYFQAGQVLPGTYRLHISTAAFGQQRAIVSINGVRLGEWLFQQQPGLAPQQAELALDHTQLHANSVNDLTIELPDARRARYFDPARLALAVAELRVASP